MTLVKNTLVMAVIIALAAIGSSTHGADKPLSEKIVANLLKSQIKDDIIVGRIKKVGVDFAEDQEAIDRLKEAGASEDVLQAIGEATKTKQPATDKPAITYESVLSLVEAGLSEDEILDHLKNSPTVFTLDKEQTAELKKAGASDKLLAALAGNRQPEPTAGDVTDFAIVLDCSGSMLETTDNNQTKMAVAKQVVADLVNKVPDGLRLTFVIYGHDKKLECQAVSVIRTLEPIDAAAKTKLSSQINALKAVGATPIALALRTAGKELAKNKAACGLVLVTDGKESCKGDPAAEAATLVKNLNLSFGAHVIGFDIKPAERDSLEAIAKAGKGKYFNAETADQLSDSIAQVVKELEQNAKPAEVVVAQRRAVKVLAPAIKEFPPGQFRLISRGLGSINIVAVANLGSEIRVPNAKTKYDVEWVAKDGKGEPVPILKDKVFSETKLVTLKPEDHLGFVRVKGEGTPKRIIVYKRGLGSILVAQESSKYGELMVVPAGKWNVSVDDNELEEDLEVEAGKIHELQ